MKDFAVIFTVSEIPEPRQAYTKAWVVVANVELGNKTVPHDNLQHDILLEHQTE